MRWQVNSERTLYQDEWIHVACADIALPDGRHLGHRLVRAADGAGAVVVVDGRVLLLWRHRFITDSWAYEIPAGAVGAEEPAVAAAREVEEETGWRPGPLRPLVYTQPMPGLISPAHHVFRADSAEYVGPPVDAFESERVEWVPLEDVYRLIEKRDIVTGTTLVALLYLLADPER